MKGKSGVQVTQLLEDVSPRCIIGLLQFTSSIPRSVLVINIYDSNRNIISKKYNI